MGRGNGLQHTQCRLVSVLAAWFNAPIPKVSDRLR